MTRKLFWLAPLVVLLIVLAGALAWLLATESGLRWSYAYLQRALPGKLEIENLSGRLAGPMAARGIRYHSDGIDARIDGLALDWSPLALLGATLKVRHLSLEGVRLSLAPSPGARDPSPPHLTPPLPLRLERFDATDVQITRPGAAAPYRLQAVQFSGGVDGDRVRIDRLELLGPQLQLTARGALGISGGSESLRVTARLMAPELPAIAVRGDLTGNLENFSFAAELNQPIAGTLRGTVENAMTQLTWRADASVPTFDISRLRPGAAGSAALQLTAKGDRTRFTAGGTLEARYPDLPRVTGRFKAHGSVDGALTLDALRLRVPGTEALATASAVWNGPTQTLEATVTWQDLRWPLTAADPIAASPSGRLEIDGTPTAYRFTLAAATQGDPLPPAQWRATGTGDLTRVVVDTLAAETMDGTLEGDARVAWRPRLAWHVRVHGQGLDPGTVWPEWPGKLAVQAQASGGPEQVRLQLDRLSGALRGRALTAQGDVVRRGAHYPMISLTAESGDARATIEGSVQNTWNLAWRISAPDLGALWPQSMGNARAGGRIGGNRATPEIRAQISGSDIVYEGYRARQLEASINLDVSDQRRSLVQARVRDAVAAGREIAQIALDAEGFVANHTIAASAQLPQAALRLNLHGGYRDAAWRGRLSESTLTIGGGDWVLAEPARLFVGRQRLELTQTCWHSGVAELCGRVNRNADGDASLALAARSAPLALLAPLIDAPLELGGLFDASAAIELRAGELQQADVRFGSSDGNVRLTTAGRGPLFAYRRAEATLRVDADGLLAHLEIRLPTGDGGVADVSLPQFNARPARGRDQPIRGKIDFALHDLTPLAALLPEVEELRGAVRADLAIAGTLADPLWRGEAQLTEATARVPVLGIRLYDGRLAASPQGRMIRLNGFARSGDGELGISGEVVFGTDSAWRAQLRLAGARFLAVDIREASVTVTPDLLVRVAPGTVNIQGEIFIPRARFAPRPRRQGAITPSPDVVIVGAPDAAPERRPGWNVTAEIKVTLGDDVAFEGFGLSGKIAGSITLIDTPAQVTTARGELRVTEGRYEAYGQKLEIARGRLLFAGGPVDDPGIDARAVRRIDSIVAGVEVRGTLKAPQLALFSDPAMSQSEALSYLLFGKPLESADASQGAAMAAAARALKLSGGEFLAQRLGARFGLEEVEIESGAGSEAALVLGKRLSPRLYINYSIGLFEPVNVVRIRYQLATNWVLQAESGPDSGADLLFTIER